MAKGGLDDDAWVTPRTQTADLDAGQPQAGPEGPQADFDLEAAVDANLQTLENAVATTLNAISVAFAAEAWAENLPIVGDELKAAFDTANPTLKKIESLALAIQAALAEARALPASTASAIQTSINTYLSTHGFTGCSVVPTIDSATGQIVLAFTTHITGSTSVAVAGDFGLPGLSLNTTGSVNAALSFDFNFSIGVDGSGFYLGTSAANELQVSLDVTAPNFSADAQLGFLNFTAANIDTRFDADFSVDLSDADGRMRWNELSNLAGSGLTAALTADGHVGLHLTGDMGDAMFPSISADLFVDWDFANVTLNGSGANTASFGTVPVVRFDNVEYNLGTFVETYIKPLLEALDPILTPLKAVIAVFDSEITFLDNWQNELDVTGEIENGEDGPDGRITLLDFIAKAADLLGMEADFAPLLQLVNTVSDVIEWVEFFRGHEFGPDSYQVGLGGFQLPSGADIRNLSGDLSDLVPQVLAGADNLSSFLASVTGGGYSAGGRDILQDMLTGGPDNPFQFPILENPLEAFRLLLGGQATLFQLNLPEVAFGFGGFNEDGTPVDTELLALIPVFPFINVRLAGAMELAFDLAFGFDTRGVQAFIDSDFTDFTAFAQGFFISDNIIGGVDHPEITLSVALQLAVEATIYGAAIGGAGDIVGQVFLDLNDTVNGSAADGRVYFDEFGQALTTNPYSLFDVSGRITAGLSAYVSVLGVEVWSLHSSRLTLASFDGRNPPAANVDVHLGSLSGGVLTLNVGDLANNRLVARSEIHEELFLSGGVIVSGWGTGGTYSGVTLIQGSGGSGRDSLALDETLNISAQLHGGSGEDYLQGGSAADQLFGDDDTDELHGGGGADVLEGGAARDFLYGETGDDTLRGGDGDDVMIGGAGSDHFVGGAGIDAVTYELSDVAVTIDLQSGVATGGEAQGDTFEGVELIFGSWAGDTMRGSSLGDFFYGLDGSDILEGRGGADVLTGGAGGDTLNGGDGFDTASYARSTARIVLNLTTPSLNTGDALGDTFISIERFDGTAHNDIMTGTDDLVLIDRFFGGGGNDTLNGMGGDDILNGGAGADAFDGGAGVDLVSYLGAGTGVTADLMSGGVGGDAQGDTYVSIEMVEGADVDVFGVGLDDILRGNNAANSLFGRAGNDVLEGRDGADYLEGGSGDDILRGGDLNDVMVGGAGSDTFEGGGGVDVVSYLTSTTGVTVNLTTGATSGDATGDTFSQVENLEGSNQIDTLTGDGGANVLWGMGANDTLNGMGGSDELRGGAGVDTLDGGDGADFLYGDADNDTLYGSAGIDELHGGLGIDTLEGGADNDTLYGEDGDDTLRGGAADDILVGGAANDTMDGGDGFDTADYSASTAYVFVNLSASGKTVDGVTVAAGRGRDGLGGLDILSNIERIVGSDFNDIMYGAATAMTLDGGAGSDRLTGGGADDILIGGRGVDFLVGGAGFDMLDYSSSTGAVRVNLSAATATLGGQSLDSQRASDGFGSIDQLTTIEGAYGSAFADFMLGGAGTQSFSGGAGDDSLDGGAGADILTGGVGADTYYVDHLSDQVIETGTDIDRVIASLDWTLAPTELVENLTLVGGARRGTGNGQNNNIIGTAFNDVLDGATGADTLEGGLGDDTYVFDSHGDRAVELADQGVDTIQLYTGGLALDPTFSINTAWAQNIENVTLMDTVRAITVTGNALNNRITAAGAATMYGNDGDDTFVVTSGATAIDGGSGTDTLIVEYGHLTAAVTYGHNGYGSNWYRTPDDTTRVTFGNIERMEIRTGSGADDLTTFDLNDIVSSGAGDDIIRSGRGWDVIDGGTGVDFWVANQSALDTTQGFTLNLTLAGVQGTYGVGGSVRGIERLDLQTGAGNDVITTLVGAANAHNDTVSTNDGDDRVVVGGGYDNVGMGGGVDTLVANYGWSSENFDSGHNGYGVYWLRTSSTLGVNYSGVDRTEFTTGSGADRLWGYDLGDILSAGAGDDILESGRGGDVIDGGTGVDWWISDQSALTTLQGFVLNLGVGGLQGSFANGGSVRGIERLTLATGAGADVITTLIGATNAHNDVLTLNDGDDRATVGGGSDSADMGGGVDTLVADYSWSNENFDSGHNGYGTYWLRASGSLGVNYAGVERTIFTTGGGGDRLWGFDLNDILSSGAGDDIIESGRGSDVIDGGSGIDWWRAVQSDLTTAMVLNLTLAGVQSSYGTGGTVSGIERLELSTGSGADVITTLVGAANAHNDVLTLNDGDDRATVGGGYDSVDMGGGVDTLVADYSWSNENFDSGHNGYGLYWLRASGSLGVNYAGVDRTVFTTGGGADRLWGYDLNDILSSGAGDDVIESGRGSDVIDGGSGIDWWRAVQDQLTTAMVLDLSTSGLQASYGVGGTVRGIERIELSTGSGNDVVTTLIGASNAHNDIITLNDGDDRVTVGGGSDSVSGGNGIDTLVADYSWSSASFDSWHNGYGTYYFRAGDLGVSYSGIDRTVFSSGGGADRLWGFDLDDILSSGAGDDTIESGRGSDVIDGGSGIDWWRSDQSALTTAMILDLSAPDLQATYGSGGSVRGIERIELSTGSGADVVTTLIGATNAHNDIVTLNDGDDRVTVGGGYDSVSGGGGFDRLIMDYSWATGNFGSSYNGYGTYYFQVDGSLGVAFNSIEAIDFRGGSGADNIWGLDADDVISGGLGNDTLDGGAGVDTLSYAERTTSVVATLNGATYGSALVGGAAEDQFRNFENLRGGSGDDVLTGDAGVNRIEGGTGNDILAGGGGLDVLDGGSGYDAADYRSATGVITVTYGATTVVSIDGVAADQLVNVEAILGGSANDVLTGDGGANGFSGGAGDDVLNGGGGADLLSGGLGNDTLNGGDGVDTVTYADATAGVTVSLLRTVSQRTIGAGNDTLIDVENLMGSAFADRMTGNALANVLTDTLGGDDRLTGGVGDDVITIERTGAGPADTVVLDGVQDNDVLTFNGHGRFLDRVTANGGVGLDTITVLGAATATINAGAGDDTVIIDTMGGGFNVTLGDGRDVLRLAGTAGGFHGGEAVVITDFKTGLAGDVLDLSAWLAGGALTNHAPGANPFLTGHLRLVQVGTGVRVQANQDGVGNDWVTLMVLRDVSLGSINAYNLGGFAASPPINGTNGPNTLNGTAGQDQINGLGGDDVLNGLAGDDALNGGVGDDILNGGAGDDQLDGGDGSDTAAYADATVGVIVNLGLTDYQDTLDGRDRLVSIENLSGSAFADRLTGDAGANRLTDSLGGDDRLDGGGGADIVTITRASGLAAGSVSLTGGEGDDALTFTRAGARVDTVRAFGEGGNDTVDLRGALNATIDAGAGDDTVILDTLGGTVNITLGAGADTLRLGGTGGVFHAGEAVTVLDFATGAGGDILDLAAYLAGGAFTNWTAGANPFASGHMRLVQAGTSVRLQANPDGAGNDFQTLLVFRNAVATAFTAYNLGGFVLAGGAAPAEADIKTDALVLPALDADPAGDAAPLFPSSDAGGADVTAWGDGAAAWRAHDLFGTQDLLGAHDVLARLDAVHDWF